MKHRKRALIIAVTVIFDKGGTKLVIYIDYRK